MRKIIAAMNMTLDGFCDHTAVDADDEIHRHYAELLKNAETALYGRITYRLMEYWRPIAKNPTGDKSTDEFATSIDRINKIVFSSTLKDVDWKSARVAKRDLKNEVFELKQQPGKDILVCSPSLIVGAMNEDLIDEYQICVHPVVAGKGLSLFKNVNDQAVFSLLKTKSFTCGAVAF